MMANTFQPVPVRERRGAGTGEITGGGRFKGGGAGGAVGATGGGGGLSPGGRLLSMPKTLNQTGACGKRIRLAIRLGVRGLLH